MWLQMRLAIVLLAFFFAVQALCHTLPDQKLRIIRDTQAIPTHLFKPVGGNSGSNDGSLRQTNGTQNDSDGEVRLLEKSSGGIEPNLDDENEEEDDDIGINRSRPFNTFIPSNFARSGGFPQSNFNQNRDFRSRPSIDIDPRVRFSPAPIYSNIVPGFRNSNGPSGQWVSRPIPQPIQSSMTPFYASAPNDVPSGNFYRSQNPRNMGSFDPSDSSSNNFYRSESYSFTSDGNGPPQIEQSVYDSRNGNGFGSSVRRNF